MDGFIVLMNNCDYTHGNAPPVEQKLKFICFSNFLVPAHNKIQDTTQHRHKNHNDYPQYHNDLDSLLNKMQK